MERCARCHGLPRPASQAPRAWPALVDNMGNRAGMTREEKSVVLQYLAAASKAALEPDPTLEPDPSSPRPETETESSGY